MKIIFQNEKEIWNNLIKSFPNWDIYYLNEYATSFDIHGDGEPILIYYEDELCRICYVSMKNDIAENHLFQNRIRYGEYYDLTSLYGYGGPLVEGPFSGASVIRFKEELTNFCVSNGIVSQFVRFHPINNNWKCFSSICELRMIKETINLFTDDLNSILFNLDSKNRNMVRKANKMGVSIVYDSGEKLNEFIKIYESTMRSNNADNYYFFGQEYFNYIFHNMSEYTVYFYAIYEGTIISAAIFFYNNRFMHYHLSGTLKEYKQLASMNLLIYEAAKWANEKGIEYLHLGGGLLGEDSLFGFKKQFNRRGRLPFYIGRSIFDIERYNELLGVRYSHDKHFDTNNSHFIQYRKE